MNREHKNGDEGDVIEIDILELIGIVLSKIWIVMVSAIALAVACYFICTLLIIPRYESTTKIYVINRQNSDTLTYSDLQTGSQLTKDYQELVTSRPVLEEVKAELGLTIDNAEFKKKITVSVPTDTRVVSITAEDTDPYMARAIADSVRISAAEHIANVMNTEAVNVVEEANLPTEISSPKIIRDTIIGGVLGAFIAVAIIVIIYIMDDTVKTPDDIEKYFNLSVLGSIPVLDEELINNSTSKKKKKKKKVSDHAHIVATEALSDVTKGRDTITRTEDSRQPVSVHREQAEEVLQEDIFSSFGRDRRGGANE